MSAEIQIRTSGFLGEHQHSPDLNTPVDSIAAPVGRRSFSCFFKSALAPLRKFVYKTPTEPGCVICTSGHVDVTRLARLVGILPVGRTVMLPDVSAILGVRFSIITSDLRFLVKQLRLPIKVKRPGILLTEPVHLCESCTRIGEQLRQNEGIQFSAVSRGIVRRERATEDWDFNSNPPPL
jgi:hypothetical protein